MNDLWALACGAGLQDGLNPCVFMTSAGLIALGFWKRLNPIGLLWLRIFFVLAYALGFLFFNFGPGQVLVLHKNFIFTAKIIYFILGVWALVTGVLFIKEWVSIHRGPSAAVVSGEHIRLSKRYAVAVFLVTVVSGLALSALATLWPINYYIVFLGNEALLKGQWQLVMTVLAAYIVIGMWPLLTIWAFLSIKNLRPSLLKIADACVFIMSSSCMIFLFK